MKLIRFGEPQKEKPGVILEDRRYDVSAFGEDYDENFFGTDGIARLEKWLNNITAELPKVPDSTRLAPPVCRPGKIVCIGFNYRDHARETGKPIPSEPVFFFKISNSIGRAER